MRATLWIALVSCSIACGSSTPAPTKDGATDQGLAEHAGASDSTGGADERSDGVDAPATACPADRPAFGATCTGALECSYGKSSCCGISTTAQTCKCQFGFFDCQQTVECNFTCPDGGLG
jgi:hypothetical protein